MEVATASSSFALKRPMFAPPNSSRIAAPIRALYNNSSPASVKTSFSANFISPHVGNSVSTLSSGNLLRTPSLNPESYRHSKGKRSVFTMVTPYRRGVTRDQPPPDLASYLYSNRIVYLGMPLSRPVAELLVAEFLYLQMDDKEKPVYFYINSTGTFKGDTKYGSEDEVFALYDTIRCVVSKISTLCVGNAWGEAALLLGAGDNGNRSALPSASIMIREPIAQFRGQATDIGLARREIRILKDQMVELYAMHFGKPIEQIEADTKRPKYFSPSEAIEYGIIDKVLYSEKSPIDRGFATDLRKQNLI